MTSDFTLGEEREVGSGWTRPEKGCRLSVVDLRTVDQDVHVGQRAG